jgi:hypothetical protein
MILLVSLLYSASFHEKEWRKFIHVYFTFSGGAKCVLY